MAKTDFKTVDEYIATFPADVQAILETIRKTIREAVPEAEEVINYQIPAYKYHGWVFYFSAYKNHFSLSCPPPTHFEAFQDELAPYKLSKSTIQFPMKDGVPTDLIRRMAQYRAQENLEREGKKK
jgi:uncharacterized protein YdhG (YjbR/CyaY superfamily)